MNRSPQIIAIVLALAPVLIFVNSTVAQIPNQVPIGARPIMMGEAFVAVADDGNAIYWNPAGLARLQRTQFSLGYANLFGFDIKNRYGGFFTRFFRLPIPFARFFRLPNEIDLRDYLAFGGNYSSIGTEDDELKFSHAQYHFSLALQPPRYSYLRHLNLGVNFKVFKLSSELDGVPSAKISGTGWDAGLLYDLSALPYVPEGLNFGLMVNDVGETKGKHRTGAQEILYPQKITWGLSYRPFGDWPWKVNLAISDPLLALAIDDRVHLGIEFWLARILALRAGWQKDRHTEEGAIWSFGFGLRTDPGSLSKAGSSFDLRRIILDVPLVDSRDVHNSRQFGVAFITKEDPRLIKLEKSHINDVFVSLYKHYEKQAGNLGKVELRNVHKDTLTVDVRFIAAPYTPKEPAQQKNIKVAPGKAVEVKLEVDFVDTALLQVTSEKELITAKIEAKYSTGSREEFRTVENVKFNLYGRDYLTWDDPSKAAAFVTSGDQCIIDFAASVVKQESSVVPFFTRNMNYALRLYEAMRALGCDWVADKTTPFSKVKIGKTEYVVDNVKYPAQFLASKSKAGDCDDLSVLFVTLLESVGVETALLSTATHLFTMFNTDIPAGRKTSLPIDTTYFVSHRGTLWMPVEATIFPASFVEAWRKGKEKYLTESPEIFDISDHQQEDRYPPASISYAAACSVAVPNVIDAVSKSSVVIAGMRDTYLEKYTREIAQDRSNLSLRNFYATILGQNDQRQEARAQLDTFFLILAQNKKRQKAQAQPDTIAKNNSTYAAALNNLANIEFVEGNFDKAESYYRDANLYNQYDKTGTYLNLAYLYAIWMTKDAASEKINKAKCIQTLKDALPWLNGDPNKTFLVLNLPASRLQGKGEKGEIDKKLPSPSPAPPDSLVKKSQQDTTRVQQQNESGFAKKAKSLVDFFINYFKSLLQGPPPSDLTFDGAGAKNDGELDEDRARILWWNTGLVLSNP